jgi:hypothetical protein
MLAEGRRRAENDLVPGTRMVLSAARGAIFAVAGLAGLLGGALACIAATVGVCAAVCVLLYGAAHLFAYVFGFGFMWGLVTACWVLLVAPVVGALAHDVWMIRRLELAKDSLTSEL